MAAETSSAGALRPAVTATSTVEPPRGVLRAAVATSLAGKVAEMVTLVLLAVLVPRALGPVDYGRFAVPLTVVTIGSLAMTLGGPTLMARYVPSASPEQRVALALTIGRRLTHGRAVQLAGVAAVAAILVLWNATAFPPLDTGLVVLALALNVVATLALQVGLGLGRTAAWSLRYPLQNAVLVVAVLALHWVAGPTGSMMAIVLAGAVALIFGVTVVMPYRGVPRPDVEVPPGAIRFGALHAAGAALVQFTHRGGVLAVALLAGSAAETGYTALAIGIALGITYAVLQTFTVSLPHLADGAHDRAEAVLRRLAGGLLVPLVPGLALVAVSLDSAVPVVFGTEYQGALAAFGPALALVALAPAHSLLVQAAALRLRPEVAAVSGLAGALAFVAAATLAVPAWGASGGTAAALAGGAAGVVVAARMLPGALGWRLTVASALGAAGPLVLAG